jgi:hypothetical protein
MGGKKMPDSTDAQNFRIQYSKTNIYEISESTTYFKFLQLIPIAYLLIIIINCLSFVSRKVIPFQLQRNTEQRYRINPTIKINKSL